MISESASASRANGGGSLLMRHTPPPLPRSRQDKRGRSIRPILPPLRLWRMFPLEAPLFRDYESPFPCDANSAGGPGK